MDRPGGVPGGLVSEVTNPVSQRVYIISTAPEIGQDYWSTAILPVVQQRVFLGLFKRSGVDVNHPVLAIIRNSQETAHEAHALTKSIVSSKPEADWLDFLPDPEPAEGYSKGAREKLHQVFGDEME